jgi:hypothetical protein
VVFYSIKITIGLRAALFDRSSVGNGTKSQE